MDERKRTAQAEIRTLQRIVDALNAVYRANWDTLDGGDLRRLSTAHGEAAFLLDWARRRDGREVVAA